MLGINGGQNILEVTREENVIGDVHFGIDWRFEFVQLENEI